MAGSSVLQIEKRADGVAVIRIDVPGEAVNTLQENFAAEFSRAFDEIEADSSVIAVVIASGKPDSFIAGADVKLLKSVRTAEEATTLARTGQRLLERMEGFRAPFVAAIHGACLGGGLELSLACRERVASDHPKTRLGLPEVQLGLLPGMGGTQRLPRLIGAEQAVDMMVTGRQLDARRAYKAGLVNEVVPPAIVVEVACQRAKALAAAPDQRKGGWSIRELFDTDEIKEFLFAENPLGRKLFFETAKKRVLEKTHGNYPAPERILEVVKIGLERGMKKGLDTEAEAFGELVMTREAAELMRIFFAQNDLKKDSGVSDPSVKPRPVTKVGVLGAGLMGAGIACISADDGGLFVRMKDRDPPALQRGLAYVRGVLDERVNRRRMTPGERDRIMSRVTVSLDYSGFADAEVVIEAVFEDIEVKRSVLRDIEKAAQGDVIFASNTSSLPIAKIAEAAKHPERVVGMHYFSPVQKMPLLEVIVTGKTAPWVTATAVALGKKQGKTVIVVNDGVGFYTSRALAPYLNEAAHLLSEGVAVQKIDRALTSFGFPVGPVALLDEVGIDVGYKVGKILYEAFGPRLKPPETMTRLLEAERFGRKNRRGFYRYDEEFEGERPVDQSVYAVLGVKPDLDKTSNEMVQRCLLQLVNEAVRCLGEGILRSPRDGDVGAIFGLGFPPYLGGPFRYVDAVGVSEVAERMRRYERQFGERFTPAPLLLEMAEAGASFYSEDPIQAAPTSRRSIAP
jgi:3-hydroxyacyl-CoA dehydrogenase / enoyl-CoA hydratase / 3-hydroxybutyryl-CoA epimerase